MTATSCTRFDSGAFHRGMLGVDDDLAVVVSQRSSACTADGYGHARALPYRPSGTWPGTASRSSRGRRWRADVILRSSS